MSKKTYVIACVVVSLSIIASYLFLSENDKAETRLNSQKQESVKEAAKNANDLTAEKINLFLNRLKKAQETKAHILKAEQATRAAQQQPSMEPNKQPSIVSTLPSAKLDKESAISKTTELQAKQAPLTPASPTIEVPEATMTEDSNELDSNKPEQLSGQPAEADPVAKYDALLAQVSLSEKEDSTWSQASQTAVVNLVESNPELQGLTLLEKNCWNTLCRFEFAPSSADQVASFNEKLDRISTLMPWPAPNYLKMNLENETYPKATLYVAREGHSLPALN